MSHNSGNGSVTDAVRSVIESVGTYLPETDVTTSAVLAGCARRPLVPLELWSGIKSRRMAGTTEFSIDLVEHAITRCLAKSRHSARDVELLICCNISKQDESDRFSLEPTTSATLLTRFDFGPIVHFDLANACAGLFTGIYVADSLIRQRLFTRALVVSGEYITHLTKTAQKEIASSRDPRLACLTLGDAAAAVMLEASTKPGIGFSHLELRSAPEHSSLCIAKTTQEAHGGAIMFTDSAGLNDRATENAVQHTLATFRDSEMDPEKIDHFILHQTSRRALRGGAAAFNRALGRTAMTTGNVVDNLTRRGNTASTSHFVALADLIEQGRIQSGHNIFFSVQASGITYGSALYALDDLPGRMRNGGNGHNGGNGSNGGNGRHDGNGHNGGGNGKAHGHTVDRAAPSEGHAGPSTPTFQRLKRRIRVESASAVLPGPQKENETQLASRAAKDCLARSAYSASDVDVLIFTGIYRSEFLSEPAVADLVAQELGIIGSMSVEARPRFFAFDIMNGSLGSLTAAWVASNLITDGQVKVAMVVSAECVQRENRGPSLGVIDSASALILDAGDGVSGFDSFSFASAPEQHGTFRSYAITAGGPARLDFNGSLEEARRQAIPELRRVMDRHLEQSGLRREDLSAVLPPQDGAALAAGIVEGLDLPAHKVVNAGRGNVSASSLAFALLSASPAEADKPLLALECSPGLQVGCAVYYGSLRRP